MDAASSALIARSDCNLCSGKADASKLNDCTITVKEQSNIYTATVKATTNTSIVEVTYTRRADGPQVCRKRPRKIDLELGSLEATSWWREDGYGTVEEEEESESEHEEESEEDDGAEGEE